MSIEGVNSKMKKIYLLLLMAHFVVSSRNLNQILDRDEWISIAKEYIRNHKPYKIKTYEPYKPRVVNLTNSFEGDFWETTVSPDETTTNFPEIFSTTESTISSESTTTPGETDFMETTTSAYESSTENWPFFSTTEPSEITTESPETSTLLQTTTSGSTFETESTLAESTTQEFLEDQSSTESPETTTDVLLSTTESPDAESTPDFFTSTEPTESTTNDSESPLTTWPWFSSTQPSDITTESILSTELQKTSTLTETTTSESTTSGSLEDQSPEISTTLLDIISTTPGFETTTTFLDIDSTETNNFSTETSPPLFNFSNPTQEATTEASKPTKTTKRASLVEDAIRPEKRKIKYTSDTEPEYYWD